MLGQQIEHRPAILDPLACGQFDPKHRLCLEIVCKRVEHKQALAALVQCPTGKRPGHRLDIILGVTAADTQGVKLQKLTA